MCQSFTDSSRLVAFIYSAPSSFLDAGCLTAFKVEGDTLYILHTRTAVAYVHGVSRLVNGVCRWEWEETDESLSH